MTTPTYEQTIKKFPEVYDAIRAEYNEFEMPISMGDEWHYCFHFLKRCRNRKTKQCNIWLGEIKHDIESPKPSYSKRHLLNSRGTPLSHSGDLYTTYIHKGMVILAGLSLGFKLKHDPTKSPNFILANWMNINRHEYDRAVRDWYVALSDKKIAVAADGASYHE